MDSALVVRTLKELWDYREALRKRDDKPETVENAQGRLLSHPEPPSPSRSPPAASDRLKFAALKAELLTLAQLAPQARGYAFEAFLKKAFDAFGLASRDPFRLHGEQIDGSFQLDGETYLIEAKWQAQPVGVAVLHTFHGKLEQKAAWTRGLFVSDSGFTEEGLIAFGRGKRIICMDGLDLYESLDRELPLNNVLSAKVRAFAETGRPLARVRGLFVG
jgi:Restriction endonuclease